MVTLKDDVLIGIFIGLLSPILILISYYYVKFYPVTFFPLYFELLLTDDQFLREIAAGYLMLSGFIFFGFANTNKMKTAYGVFITTLFLGLITFFINVIYG